MLTPKQKRFVEEYLVDLNATQAATRAGYSGKTARQMGAENLSKPDIQAALRDAMEARSRRTEVTADAVISELAAIAFANMSDYLDWGPNGVALRGKAELTRNQCAALAEISETLTKSGATRRIKLYDKISALEKLGRHLGLFRDSQDPSAKKDEPAETSFAQEFFDRIALVSERMQSQESQGDRSGS